VSSAAPDPAQRIVAPQVRDLNQLARSLVEWLSGRLSEARSIEVSNLSYPRGAGMSHETILFDARWSEQGCERQQGMVVRIKPTRHKMYHDDLFDAQFRVIQLMYAQGNVRVARPLSFEADPCILGAPFFVMEKVSGQVAISYPPYSKQGWLVDATPAQRRRLWVDAVTQLAEIQRVPTEKASFLELPGGGGGFDQEVHRWRRFIEWVDPDNQRTLLRDTFLRLLAMGPRNRCDGIVWGDSRLGNMMIGADFKVAAVMDWEQPSLGGALQDLGWWLQTDRAQTISQGIQPLEGMGTREETIALWGEVCGKPSDDIAWYEAFACFKMECLAIRMAAIRDLPPNVVKSEPGSRTEKMLDAL
jgi:aminoglycoside phosphotransferase (APT) family kinase protein